LPLVYDELRRFAAARLAHEATGQTFDASALIYEAYLRLGGDQQLESRGHFFSAAREVMRGGLSIAPGTGPGGSAAADSGRLT
jgi:hypothetical protein